MKLHQLRMMPKRSGQESMKKAPVSSLIPSILPPNIAPESTLIPSAILANLEVGSALRVLELAKKILPPTFSFTGLSFGI